MQYPLDQSFEATGKWWLPEKPEHPVFGTLTYSTTQITLTLHGSLTEYSRQDTAFPETGQRFSQVFGWTSDGRLFTLLNAFVQSINLKLFPTVTDGRMVIKANYLVVGAHTASFDELRLSSIQLNCNGLAPFLAYKPCDLKPATEGGELILAYKQPEPVAYRIEPLTTNLVLRLNGEFEVAAFTAGLRWDALAEIIPDSSRPLKWFVETVWRFCDLVGLLTDESVRPLELRLGHDEKESFDGWLLYAAGQKYEERKCLNPAELLFCLPDISQQLPTILHNWFSSGQTLAKSIHLFRATNRKNSASAERFLNATKSVEAFSRSLGQSEYMPSSDYAKIEDQLLAAIPASVSTEHRRSLKARIHFGNEHSLRKRIVSLVRSLSPNGQALVCKKAQDFADGVVKTRNYFTHYSDDPDTIPLTGIDLFWACEKLVMLMRLCLLRYISLDEAQAIKSIAHHCRLSQSKPLWEKCREVPCVEAKPLAS
jgi:hypothetical protein